MQHFICLGGGLHRQVVSLPSPREVYQSYVHDPGRHVGSLFKKLKPHEYELEAYHLRRVRISFTVKSDYLPWHEHTMSKQVLFYVHQSLTGLPDALVEQALGFARRDHIFEKRLIDCALGAYGL